MKKKILPVVGAVCWLLGLALSILGMNLHSSSGSAVAVCGNILFLIGLGLEGVVWFRKQKQKEEDRQKEDPIA